MTDFDVDALRAWLESEDYEPIRDVGELDAVAIVTTVAPVLLRLN